MAVYTRPDSPYYWIFLEGSRARFPTQLRIEGITPAQSKANKALAEQVYHASMGDIVRERFALPTTRPARTFEDQAAWYETHHTAQHRGALQERRKLAHLRAFFGNDPLGSITPARWKEYEIKRLTRKSHRTRSGASSRS